MYDRSIYLICVGSLIFTIFTIWNLLTINGVLLLLLCQCEVMSDAINFETGVLKISMRCGNGEYFWQETPVVGAVGVTAFFMLVINIATRCPGLMCWLLGFNNLEKKYTPPDERGAWSSCHVVGTCFICSHDAKMLGTVCSSKKHLWCETCARTWLRQKTTCPFCRRECSN